MKYLFLLQIVLLVSKLTGFVNWSWIVILFPIWIPASLIALFIIGIFIIACVSVMWHGSK